MIPALVGGIGLFLLGMILLTEGLRSAAGGALRTVLERFTRGRFSAVVAGATVTAVVQSSSATTLATIGFVSAGLLTFPHAVGVIFGASLGTTSTGWIVSLLGLRFGITSLALPLIGAGAVLRLLAGGRGAHVGLALAGFGLIFVGIDTLQVGMADLSERLDPGDFPSATPAGRLLLVLIGIAMTVVMQSSSAAVATTLTALAAGTVTLEQAGSLVVGQNVGTSVKAALVSIGASVPARRTALAHILYNSFCGLLAVVAFPVLLAGAALVADGLAAGDPAVTIAAFHTSFNLLGLAVVLPFSTQLAHMVERLVHDPYPAVTRHLDRSVAGVPGVAVEAARRAAVGIAALLLDAVSSVLGPDGARGKTREDALARAELALDDTRAFLARVHTSPEDVDEYHRHLAVLHAVDHLQRLRETVASLDPFLEKRLREEGAPGPAGGVARLVPETAARLRGDPAFDPGLVAAWEAVATRAADFRRGHRASILEATAGGRTRPAEARHEIETAFWIDRVGYHAWRAIHHLMAPAEPPPGAGREPPEPEGDGSRGE